eukprot:979737-Prorocentrum_minimum.AAC.1
MSVSVVPVCETYILTTDQSDAGSVGIFSRKTNQTQEAWVYSHDGPGAALRASSPSRSAPGCARWAPRWGRALGAGS